MSTYHGHPVAIIIPSSMTKLKGKNGVVRGSTTNGKSGDNGDAETAATAMETTLTLAESKVGFFI